MLYRIGKNREVSNPQLLSYVDNYGTNFEALTELKLDLKCHI